MVAQFPPLQTSDLTIHVVPDLTLRKPPGYWWVNQNKTYKDEVLGGFLWSPELRSDGKRNQFYDFMKDVLPGDIIFSFCDTRIKAIGVASGSAQTSPKPDFGAAGDGWSKEGWLVRVEYKELTQQIRPEDHMPILIRHLPTKYSPLQKNGNGLQSVYLAKIDEQMAMEIARLIGPEYRSVFEGLAAEVIVEHEACPTSEVDGKRAIENNSKRHRALKENRIS